VTDEPSEKILGAAAPAAPAGKPVANRHAANLPTWFPGWASQIAELYFSGTTSMFALHGNVHDFVRLAGPREGAGGDEEVPRFGTLAEFVAEQLFGRWDLILHYDLARGIRCLAGNRGDRLKEMVQLANRYFGELRQIGREPATALKALDLFIQKNVMTEPDKRVSAAILIDHGGYVAPRGDRLDLAASTNLVTLLNWASSPYVKRLNMATIVIEQRLSDLSERLTANPHVAAIEIPLPSEAERAAFLKAAVGGRDLATFSDYGAPEMAKLTAGIALTDVNVMIQSSVESGRRLDSTYFRTLKKRLIERQAQGLLEFIEPKWGLDTVVGHEAAKKRLADDAELIKRGQVDTVPMGYLMTGPVGTGKSFLAQCAAGSIGIPCVMLKNFRSKYVGETEGNLERVLTVLRSMGPVLVVVDEADTMLGDREGGGGDGGVSSRIFGMIATQMGDTRYRGRILWMLLTTRPDLLPIDLKRQGRAEVHIPLFYPTEDAELRQMFLVLARKAGTKLAPEDLVAEIPHRGNLSGADIEGIIGRAWRTSLLAGADHITKDALAHAVASFMPSTQTLERELQELAAIIECTDAEFLPPSKVERIEKLGGREKLQERLNAIKQILGS
jgi:AAA+ superfamily predicted ATPase